MLLRIVTPLAIALLAALPAQSAEMPEFPLPREHCLAAVSSFSALAGETAEHRRGFAYELSTSKPRTLTAATLAVMTSRHVYFFTLPPMDIKLPAKANDAGPRDFLHAYVSDRHYLLLQSNEPVKYIWVEGASEGASRVECPTFPFTYGASKEPPESPPPSASYALSNDTVDIRDEPLPCGQEFIGPRSVAIVTPDTPAIARLAGQTGTAWIMVEVTPHDETAGIALYRSSGWKMLDDAALKAAAKSKFATARFLCVPIYGYYLFVVQFQSP